VPVNFAFSFAAGLLAGNANIVRLPWKNYEQVQLICKTVKDLVENEYSDIAPYIAFVKYPPVQEITDIFSSISDIRVVWGGDGTIAEMRLSPLKARANEITFADRHSIAVIDADGYLRIADKDKIAQDFYNDTYFSDQNACTAPKVVVWLGNEKDKAKEEFWRCVHMLVKMKYSMSPVQSIGKLAAFYRAACQVEVKLVQSNETNVDEYITRVLSDKLETLMEYKYNSGFFFEYNAEDINEILPLCDERCQTLTYCGINEETLRRFLFICRPRGVDRAVPLGESMNFTLIWDGHDLIREMSRYINMSV
jgi:hypothetical protein